MTYKTPRLLSGCFKRLHIKQEVAMNTLPSLLEVESLYIEPVRAFFFLDFMICL